MPRKIAPGPLTGKRLDGDTVVVEIRKSENDTIVVKATIYNGYPSVHARIAYHADNGELRYTRKGFSVKTGDQLEALIKGLTEAGRLLGDDDATPVTSPPQADPVATVASANPVVTNGTGAPRVYDEGGPYAHLSNEQLRDIFVPRTPDGTKREAMPAEQAAYDAELKARLERAQRRQFPDR